MNPLWTEIHRVNDLLRSMHWARDSKLVTQSIILIFPVLIAWSTIHFVVVSSRNLALFLSVLIEIYQKIEEAACIHEFTKLCIVLRCYFRKREKI